MGATLTEHFEIRRGQFYPKADVLLSDGELRGLRSSPLKTPLHQVRAALHSNGIPATSVTPMDGVGTFHELYDCVDAEQKAWVLKINRMSDQVVDFPLVTEHAISRMLADHGLPHGRVVAVDLSRTAVPFDFEVMEYVAGETFRDFDADEDEVLRQLPALAQYLRECHKIDMAGFGLTVASHSCDAVTGVHTGWGEYLLVQLEEHVRLLFGAGLVSAKEAAEISDIFSQLESVASIDQARLLHGDCGPQNTVLTPDGRISMIDWEDAVAGDPLFEVAMWATFNPTRRWQSFFDSYFAEEWKPDFLFWAYFLRIALAKSVVRLRFDYKDVPGRPPAAMRVQQALDALSPRRRSL